jgi:DNA-directed RNA polymerase subunit RPC12/RpoP
LQAKRLAEEIKQKDLEQAREFERAFRLEDAALVYEKYGMIDEAGHVRRKGLTTKTIQVDLNTLLEQMRSGGLVAEYKCPSCGGGIEVKGDSNTEGLRFCSYCGSRIETVGLADFLTKLLSILEIPHGEVQR